MLIRRILGGVRWRANRPLNKQEGWIDHRTGTIGLGRIDCEGVGNDCTARFSGRVSVGRMKDLRNRNRLRVWSRDNMLPAADGNMPLPGVVSCRETIDSRIGCQRRQLPERE